jgi:hypothetical protein
MMSMLCNNVGSCENADMIRVKMDQKNTDKKTYKKLIIEIEENDRNL